MPEATRKFGWKLLVRALAAEAALAFFLVVVDSTISIRQRAKIAGLFDRATKAELELIQIKSPRTPDSEKFVKELDGTPIGKVQILYVKECSDCFWLAQFISHWLESAKWEVTEVTALETPAGPLAQIPTAMSARGRPCGITVIAKSPSQDLTDSSSWSVVFRAIRGSLDGNPSMVGINDQEMPEGLVRVVVAPRP